MYFCYMKNKHKFIHLLVSTDDTYKYRYFILLELIDDGDPKLHIIPHPDWLVFYSEKYIYYCINLN
jgi:hypothetical protein